jgi:hypothetical protein
LAAIFPAQVTRWFTADIIKFFGWDMAIHLTLTEEIGMFAASSLFRR